MEMLKELFGDDVSLGVLVAEMYFGDRIDFHMEVECGFFRIRNTLMIQDGKNRRYFELEGEYESGMGCGYREAMVAYEAGLLPEDLNHMFEERAAAESMEELVVKTLLERYVGSLLGLHLESDFEQNESEPDSMEDDIDLPPSGFTEFFGISDE